MTEVRRLLGALFATPAYPPEAADLRTISIAGMRLPLRATVVIAVTVLAVIFDFSRTFIPDDLIQYDRNPGMQRLQAIDRLVLYALAPLLVIVVAFRDSPERYGIRLGDWKVGASLAVLGCALMTPIVLWFATQPDARSYYAPSWSSLPDVLVTNVLDLASAEFLFRGFLMFALVRTLGPIGVLIAAVPFALSHLTKPELELISTLGGGLLYGWLAWRTGSIVWGAAAHIYIVTLVMAAAAAG